MDYLAAWMFLALTILLMTGFPVTFTLLGTALTFGMIGFGWDFFNLLPIANLGSNDQCNPGRGAPVCLYGRDAGTFRTGRRAVGYHGPVVRPPEGGSGDIGRRGGDATGRVNRYRGSHRRHHGASGRSHDAKTRLSKGACNRHCVSLRNPRTNYPAKHRPRAHRRYRRGVRGGCVYGSRLTRDYFWWVFLSYIFLSLPICAPGWPPQFQKKN